MIQHHIDICTSISGNQCSNKTNIDDMWVDMDSGASVLMIVPIECIQISVGL